MSFRAPDGEGEFSRAADRLSVEEGAQALARELGAARVEQDQGARPAARWMASDSWTWVFPATRVT